MKMTCAKTSCISLDINDIDGSAGKKLMNPVEDILVNDEDQVSWK